MKRVVLSVIAGISVILAVLLFAEPRYVYPNDNTRSTFIKTYDPEKLVDQFRRQDRPYSQGGSGDSSAGTAFASHHHTWQSDVLIKTGCNADLLPALEKDVLSSLSRSGALVVNQLSVEQKAREGIEFKYLVGNTKGIVVAHLSGPLGLTDAGLASIPAGESVVRLKVEIRERWFKSRDVPEWEGWP